MTMCSSCTPIPVVHFNNEDLQVVERLREKYTKNSSNAPPSAEGFSDQALQKDIVISGSPASSGITIDAKVCAACQGMGKIMEEYNHRVLEKACLRCDGRGVTLYKDGVEVQEGATSQPRGSDTGGGSSKAAPTTSIPERIQKLESDVQRMDAKLTGYTQELEILQGQYSDCGAKGDQAGKILHQEVITQLNACHSKLSTHRGKKFSELQRLLKPITIEDIIKNEQPVS